MLSAPHAIVEGFKRAGLAVKNGLSLRLIAYSRNYSVMMYQPQKRERDNTAAKIKYHQVYFKGQKHKHYVKCIFLSFKAMSDLMHA